MGVMGGEFGCTVDVADADRDDFMVHIFLTNIMLFKIIFVQIVGFIGGWRGSA